MGIEMHEMITVSGGLLAGLGIAVFFWGGRRAEEHARPAQAEAVLDVAIEGMTCAACVARVEKALRRVPGVASAEVSLPTERGRVWFDPATAVVADILAAVRKIGYGAEDASRVSRAESELRRHREMLAERNRFLVSLLCFLPLMGAMVPGMPRAHWGVEAGLAAVATFGAGASFLGRAWKALKARSADMSVLISIGAVSAFAYSLYLCLIGHSRHTFFETAAGLIALVTLGRYLETRARAKAGDAMKALMGLRPKTASLLTEEGEREVLAEDLKVGDRVLVRPGEKVPADGVILVGTSEADESLLTGESAPVPKSAGDKVFAGSLNGHGAIEVRVDTGPGDSTLMRILRLVDAAQASRPPVQRLADQISGVFVPVILLIAIGTFVLWYGFLPSFGLERAVMNAVTVLIIACPCALGLATPASIVVGIGRGASMGVLFRDAEALEKLGSVRAMCLDKTGTLTEGKPKVVALCPVNGASQDELLAVAAAIEAGSEHPLARAVTAEAAERGLAFERPDRTTAVAGLGVRAEWPDGKIGVVGRQALLEQSGTKVDGHEMVDEGHTVALVGLDRRFLGSVALGDPLRPEAPEALRRLRALGVKLHMLTGDNAATAQAIAQKLGLEEVHAEVMPDEKAALVRSIRQARGATAMVGDGVNDAPALAAADVGIAMGSGSEAAMETADVTIVNTGLQALPDAVELSRATLRNIRQNLLFAFLYNSLCIPLAAGALYPLTGHFLPPLAAAAAMALSSVSVVTNSLRLRRWLPRRPT
ncbi:MAG: copper-translocating P-type ATPase [Fimbriimonadia bacterium]